MTLNEIIERLQDLRDNYEVDGYAQVTGAFQPNYPLLADIEAITTIIDAFDGSTRIYLGLGGAESYGSGKEWDDDIIDLSQHHNNEDDDDCQCNDCRQEFNWIQEQLAAANNFEDGGVTAHYQDDGTFKCAGWDGLNAMTTEQLEPIAELIAARIAWQQFNINNQQEDTAQ
jgi:hypothetical protein